LTPKTAIISGGSLRCGKYFMGGQWIWDVGGVSGADKVARWLLNCCGAVEKLVFLCLPQFFGPGLDFV